MNNILGAAETDDPNFYRSIELKIAFGVCTGMDGATGVGIKVEPATTSLLLRNREQMYEFIAHLHEQAVLAWGAVQ